MLQSGWLDYAYGFSHLVLEDDDYPVRYWSDKEAALTELEEEGWLLAGALPRRYRRRWAFDRTYSLVRFLQ